MTIAALIMIRFFRDALERDCFDAGNRVQFDKIIMNPPFENDQPVYFIYHAFNTLLSKGGTLVAIVPNGLLLSNHSRRKERRLLGELLENYCIKTEDIPSGAFTASGTNVKTSIIILEKPN